MKFARHEAAKAWCQPTTKNIEMIPELAEAFAEIIHEIWSQPWLGTATTRELVVAVPSHGCDHISLMK